MRQIGIFCAFGVLAAPAAVLAQEQVEPAVDVILEEEAAALDLADFLWLHRPIVVFADTPNDPRFRQQMQMLERELAELEDRDVVVLTDADPAANGPLRTALRPRDFMLVLIDKDGTVVQRRPTPTSVRELTRTIDRLPSRRQETGSLRQ